MIARPVSVWPADIGFEPLDDLETLTDILQVARAFFAALADDTEVEGLVDGHPTEARSGAPVALTAALVRQALGLSARQARNNVPAGRAAVFDDRMWSVGFVDALTAAQGDGVGLLLYFVPTRTGWNVLPGALYGPRVIRRISFPTSWPDPSAEPSA